MLDVIPACPGATPLDMPERPPGGDVQQGSLSRSPDHLHRLPWTLTPGADPGNSSRPIGHLILSVTHTEETAGLQDDQCTESVLLQLSGADAPPLGYRKAWTLMVPTEAPGPACRTRLPVPGCFRV